MFERLFPGVVLMLDQLTLEIIKNTYRYCVCGKRKFRWFHLEYSQDMMTFLEGKPIYCHTYDYTGCGDEEE